MKGSGGMIEVLRHLQLDLMLVLSGISAAVAFFLVLTKSLDKERKTFLILANVFSVILLLSDRTAYEYRGSTASGAFWIVRISNFLIFAMVIMILEAFNNYVQDICMDETVIEKVPFRLKLNNYLLPVLADNIPEFHRIHVVADPADLVFSERNAVATGWTGGADSMYTFMQMSGDGASDIKLTHLLIANNGALESDNNEELLRSMVANAENGIAREAGLSVIGVNSKRIP